jgi:hypothetical protein
MTKNNLKVVKTTKAQQAEGNEKNKALDDFKKGKKLNIFYWWSRKNNGQTLSKGENRNEKDNYT